MSDTLRAEGEECRRCGAANFIWSAPSPLWNYVMRDNKIDNEWLSYGDLVCIRCFLHLADEMGLTGTVRVTIDPEPDGLIYTTPTGRVWNADRWLWEVPP